MIVTEKFQQKIAGVVKKMSVLCVILAPFLNAEALTTFKVVKFWMLMYCKLSKLLSEIFLSYEVTVDKDTFHLYEAYSAS